MPDTTNHPTCTVCGGLNDLTLIDDDEWICATCDEKSFDERPNVAVDAGLIGTAINVLVEQYGERTLTPLAYSEFVMALADAERIYRGMPDTTEGE